MTRESDKSPDRLSGLGFSEGASAGIPTRIPTNCRDLVTVRLGQRSTRHLSRQDGGTPGRRDMMAHSRPIPLRDLNANSRRIRV